MEELSNPHLAVGNGQHLACATLALLASLTAIELFEDPSPSADLVPTPHHNVEINPAADGHCFFSCLYLHFASMEEKRQWAAVDRNPSGFPISTERQKLEDPCHKSVHKQVFSLNRRVLYGFNMFSSYTHCSTMS